MADWDLFVYRSAQNHQPLPAAVDDDYDGIQLIGDWLEARGFTEPGAISVARDTEGFIYFGFSPGLQAEIKQRLNEPVIRTINTSNSQNQVYCKTVDEGFVKMAEPGQRGCSEKKIMTKMREWGRQMASIGIAGYPLGTHPGSLTAYVTLTQPGVMTALHPCESCKKVYEAFFT